MKTKPVKKNKAIKTITQLASAIAKREGKKHQASIGDVREILRILEDLTIEYCHTSPNRYSSPLYLIFISAFMKATRK